MSKWLPRTRHLPFGNLPWPLQAPRCRQRCGCYVARRFGNRILTMNRVSDYVSRTCCQRDKDRALPLSAKPTLFVEALKQLPMPAFSTASESADMPQNTSIMRYRPGLWGDSRPATRATLARKAVVVAAHATPAFECCQVGITRHYSLLHFFECGKIIGQTGHGSRRRHPSRQSFLKGTARTERRLLVHISFCCDIEAFLLAS
jgi:hypothetical protein